MNRWQRQAVIGIMRAQHGKNPFRMRKRKAEHRHLRMRHAREDRFRFHSKMAVGVSLIFLVFLLYTILANGLSAFLQTQIRLSITFSQEVIDPSGTDDREALQNADYRKLVNEALAIKYPEIQERREKMQLYALLSKGNSDRLRNKVLQNPDIIGTTQPVWLIASSDVDMLVKGKVTRRTPQDERRLKDNQIGWLDTLKKEGALRQVPNLTFFTRSDSRDPEMAGVLGAVVGSFLTILVCIAVAFPIGVGAATYLEEFAPKNRWADLIEININNLAAVPSIIYGLLALEVYLNVFGLQRSSPLVGGLTLALLVLPIIVITTRNALASVPGSLRYAATALGATKVQVTFHHTLPYAMPGIMTGTILSIARALGETAPLLMIGMVAFVADVPGGITEAATALPVQIYLWSDSPEIGFVEKTSACIIVLLVFLTLANALAVYLRKKFKYDW